MFLFTGSQAAINIRQFGFRFNFREDFIKCGAIYLLLKISPITVNIF